MKITKTPLGLTLFYLDKFDDERGSFKEIFGFHKYYEIAKTSFVQDNVSISKKGVIRGLHFQHIPFAQAKLITVLQGSLYDAVVNLEDGKYEANYLTPNNQLFIPDNFAHGFQALEDNTIVSYKVTNYYNKQAEKTIIYNDPDLNIPWPINNPIVSEKDLAGIRFKDIKCN